MDLHIEELNKENIELWEDFNQKMEEGTFFHTIKWKKVLELLGYTSYYNMIFDGDEPVAICPFFEINIKGFNGITTLPESDYNHLIIKDNDPHIIDFISKEVKSIAKEKAWSFIIFNSLDENFESKLNTSYYPNFSIGTMMLDLEQFSPAKIWNEIFTAKKGQRRYINRFKNDGFQIKILNSFKDIEVLYKYYKLNIKHINGTLYPYSHFKDLYDIYSPKNIYSALLCKDDFIAGGFLNFLDKNNKTMHLRYVAINRDIPNKYHVQYYLLWDSIKKADELGFKKLSMGSTLKSQEHNGYKFKRRFGANYIENYSALISTSKLFKLGLRTYRSIKSLETK